MLIKISQTEKDKYSMLSLISGIYKMKGMNYNKTETDSEVESKLPVGKGKWGGTSYGYGIKRYKLLGIKSISNKDILYSKGKYSHYFVLTLNGV